MTLGKGHVTSHVIRQALSCHITRHVTNHVIRQALSHHMTSHMTDHVIRQALSRHMIIHVILGKDHLTSQGIGQQYGHVPFKRCGHAMHPLIGTWKTVGTINELAKNQQSHTFAIRANYRCAAAIVLFLSYPSLYY